MQASRLPSFHTFNCCFSFGARKEVARHTHAKEMKTCAVGFGLFGFYVPVPNENLGSCGGALNSRSWFLVELFGVPPSTIIPKIRFAFMTLGSRTCGDDVICLFALFACSLVMGGAEGRGMRSNSGIDGR